MSRTLLAATLVLLCAPVWGDPCGMVPPASAGTDPDRYLIRTGDQITYVFWKDGIQDMVLRPEFKGKITEFGMLIPFPTPPALRKVADDIFWHCKHTAEPPTVEIDLRVRVDELEFCDSALRAAGSSGGLGFTRERDSVRVIREEAVGMYQAVVLEAGSAEALKKWMTAHGYIFPHGMESACEYYVEKGWCFVAERARIAQKAGIDPKPGMTDTQAGLPPDAMFNGALQAMGFRFKTAEPVMPLRLSAHNGGPTHNIVYVVTPGGVRIDPFPAEFVRKQIAGDELYRNLTGPLPAKITQPDGRVLDVAGGDAADVARDWAAHVAQMRNPAPYSGKARELIASDLLAARHGRLIHEYEERQKELLNIGEELGLRGPHVDDLIHADQEQVKQRALATALEDAKGMTLTLVEGDFARELMVREDTKFAGFLLPEPRLAATRRAPIEPVVVILLLIVVGTLVIATRKRAGSVARVVMVAAMGTALLSSGRAQDPGMDRLVGKLWQPELRADAMKEIVAKGAAAVPALAELAKQRIDGDNPTARGWACVCLARIGDKSAVAPLTGILMDANQRPLVRLWAAGAMGAIDPRAALETMLDGLGQGTFGWSNQGMGWGWGWGGRRGWRGVQVPQPEAPPQDATLYDCINKYLVELAQKRVDALISLCLRDTRQHVRQMAASYLGAADSPAMREQFIAALAFRPGESPWHGGPLFMPGIQWGADTRPLMRTLIHWMLESGGQDQDWQILRNNLVSLGQQQQMPCDWNWQGADWAIGWVDKWSDAPKLEAGELLVHALERDTRRAADLLKRLRALAGEDRGGSASAWRKWLEGLRK